MSNSDNELSDIEDIFGISKDMKNAEEQDDVVDFDMEVEKLNLTMSKEETEQPLKELEIAVKKKEKKTVESIEKTIVQSINKTNLEDQKNKEISVEKTIEMPINIVEDEEIKDEEKYVNQVLEEVDVIEENQKNKLDENENCEEEIIDFDIPKSTEIEWIIKSTDSRFENFYAEKRLLLKDILVGGVLPFKDLMKELKGSYVDISHPTFDTEMASIKMDRVQKMRDRISQIAIDCNQQYYPWKRGVELMQGLLARTQYEKPAAKQDGLIYEHMKDIEVYFHKLESLHYSIDAITRNLDGAFDCLSRRATIALPSRPVERKYLSSYEHVQNINVSDPKENPKESKFIEDVPNVLLEYDSLPDDAKDKVTENIPFKKKLRKSGKVSWNEI